MKLKHLFYCTRILWEHHLYFTMKGWLRYKDSILDVKRYKNVIVARYGIKLQPKYRHRRSISVRDVGRLYGTDIDWLQSKIDYPRWSFDRRVYRKSKDGTVWYGALMRIYFYEDK